MKLDTQHERFILNIDKDRLKDAPDFDKDHWPDMADQNWAREIHSLLRNGYLFRRIAAIVAFKGNYRLVISGGHLSGRVSREIEIRCENQKYLLWRNHGTV
ncbi:hypothetical protein ACFS07_35135 [Undibacterium arcticum]